MKHQEPQLEQRPSLGFILTFRAVDLQNRFRARLSRSQEQGATAVEYALMVGLLSVAIIVSVYIFSQRLRTSFATYSNTIPN